MLSLQHEPRTRAVRATQRRVLTRSTAAMNKIAPWFHPFNYLADSKLKLFKIIIMNKSNSLCTEQHLPLKINNFNISKET